MVEFFKIAHCSTKGVEECGRRVTREVLCGVVVSGSQNEEEDHRGRRGPYTKSEFTMDRKKACTARG
jgi:hypothetical protein